MGIGLQHKSVDQLEKEIELPSGQLMGLFNRIIRKVVKVTSAEGRALACVEKCVKPTPCPRMQKG